MRVTLCFVNSVEVNPAQISRRMVQQFGKVVYRSCFIILKITVYVSGWTTER